ncbi:MAG: hypothetical protein Q8916_03135 [Bacteroidota bacterium]|nr:hypothetical protein [Bacteroidota bacterium]MDP4229382.1 hypothetical protein [Bacteroidota bacterium]MDP4235186.1 hypothetical protein [Bacteroidota bacterium]
MKKLLAFCFALLFAGSLYAQGGMGKLPREDVVMLSQVVRDSLSDEMFGHILNLKRYALAGNLDSAATEIAWNGGATKEGRWAHACSLANQLEADHVKEVVEKFRKMFTEYPDMHQEYFAVFKSKDSPAGQMMHYQINLVKGNKKRMVSFHYFPIGDRLLYGESN